MEDSLRLDSPGAVGTSAAAPTATAAEPARRSGGHASSTGLFHMVQALLNRSHELLCLLRQLVEVGTHCDVYEVLHHVTHGWHMKSIECMFGPGVVRSSDSLVGSWPRSSLQRAAERKLTVHRVGNAL